MEQLLQSVKIGINENIFIKDPESSDLGRRILEKSKMLIHDLGFDNFTFKKLGDQIDSNESSIYRYFEGKHKLLLYLASWYWGWLEYRLVFATNSIQNPEEKLSTAIKIITKPSEESSSFSYINQEYLAKIMINEFSKSYLTKNVDLENRDGYFLVYKRLVKRLATMIQTLDADYKYPFSLSSSILEGALHQFFLMDHFPTITDCNSPEAPSKYYVDLVFRILNRKSND